MDKSAKFKIQLMRSIGVDLIKQLLNRRPFADDSSQMANAQLKIAH